MKIVSFYSHKGGVTKTTSTILSATNLTKHFKKKLAIVDCDEGQWSTYSLYEKKRAELEEEYSEEEINQREKKGELVFYPVVKAYINSSYETEDSASIDDVIKYFEDQKLDYLFLDFGNRSLDSVLDTFKKVDYFFIPFSRDEEEVLNALKTNYFFNQNLPSTKSYLFMTKLSKSSSELQFLDFIKDQIKDQGFEMLKQPVLSRQKYIFDNRSFFKPMTNKEDKEEKEYSFIKFINELKNKIK
ncbi:AAA family ATPase [Empedobacter falsenii]